MSRGHLIQELFFFPHKSHCIFFPLTDSLQSNMANTSTHAMWTAELLDAPTWIWRAVVTPTLAAGSKKWSPNTAKFRYLILKADLDFNSSCTKMRLVLAERSEETFAGRLRTLATCGAHLHYLLTGQLPSRLPVPGLANEALLTSTL